MCCSFAFGSYDQQSVYCKPEKEKAKLKNLEIFDYFSPSMRNACWLPPVTERCEHLLTLQLGCRFEARCWAKYLV